MTYAEDTDTCFVGCYIPRVLGERLDRNKGLYSKSKFIQKIIQEYLDEQEQELETTLSVAAQGERRHKK